MELEVHSTGRSWALVFFAQMFQFCNIPARSEPLSCGTFVKLGPMGPSMECILSSWSDWWLGRKGLKIYWAWFKSLSVSGSGLSSNLRSRIQASKRPSWLPKYKFLKEVQALQGPLWRGASFNLLFLSSPETSETFLKSQMFRKSLQVPSKHLGRESTIALIHHV